MRQTRFSTRLLVCSANSLWVSTILEYLFLKTLEQSRIIVVVFQKILKIDHCALP
jgi:hypothetical protein